MKQVAWVTYLCDTHFLKVIKHVKAYTWQDSMSQNIRYSKCNMFLK